jgi:hypothetical protein
MANPKPQILGQCFKQGQSALHSVVLLRLREPAKLPQRLGARRICGHAAFNVLLDRMIDMRAQLFVEVVVQLAFAKERRAAAQQNADQIHICLLL